MKIVVLDGYTLNPGDLSWDALKERGEVTVYDRTPVDQVVARAAGATILLTNKTIVNAAAIRSLPDLQYIGVMATGYNIVDTGAAKERGIIVTNVAGYSSLSVAQLTFALILELCNHVGLHDISVKAGEWANSKDFCYWKAPLTELSGKTLGLIGLGQIGRQVAVLGKAFGMKPIAYRRRASEEKEISVVDLHTLAGQSDIVSLHCPLTEENAGMINAAFIAEMKPSAFLINTSRGPLLNEHDVAVALQEGKIAGAGLDVLSIEPPAKDNPLLHAPNCIITPHIGWASGAARKRLMDSVVSNIAAFQQGRPINVIG